MKLTGKEFATVFLNERGNIVGLYDEYDFNALPWGERSIKNEIKTRLVKAISLKNAKAFSIKFGYDAK